MRERDAPLRALFGVFSLSLSLHLSLPLPLSLGLQVIPSFYTPSHRDSSPLE
ncbi:hypothetical protein LY78DRAFT_651237 [Colletotrichum sublineola]|nr:hypothetical protein LY78DRAFT_651237 [Colletotrichum sublineola]